MADLPEQELVFLFDENMPQRLANALRGLGERCFHVYDPEIALRGAPDEIVLRHAGERRWLVVGRDHGILQRPHERAVLSELGMGAFFLNQTLDKSLCSITQAVVRNWPQMKRLGASQARPFLYLVRATSVSAIRRRHMGPPKRSGGAGRTR
jgi:hypothetical protein